MLLDILNEFEDLFDGTIREWYTEPIDPELKPISKPFNGRYDLVLRINKETFHREFHCLVEIGVFVPV